MADSSETTIRCRFLLSSMKVDDGPVTADQNSFETQTMDASGINVRIKIYNYKALLFINLKKFQSSVTDDERYKFLMQLQLKPYGTIISSSKLST